MGADASNDRRPPGPAVFDVTLDPAQSSPAEEIIAAGPAQRGWWPVGRAQQLGLVAAFVAAVVVAFIFGRNQSRSGQAGTASATISRPSTVVAGSGPAMVQGNGLCATQVGGQLQLGVEVVNRSALPLTLQLLDAVLPLGGLRAANALVGTCGQLQLTRAVPGTELAAGATAWLTITFDVLVTCPGPLPVQFVVSYSQADQLTRMTLGGFADLGGVSYSGCDATG